MITRYFDGVVPAGDAEPRIVGRRRDCGAGVCPALRCARFFPRARSFVGFRRGGRRLHHGKGSLEAGGLRRMRLARSLLASILYTCAEALRIITALVYPVLPDAAARIWAQLGLGDIAHADLKDVHWGQLAPGTKLGRIGPYLSPRRKGHGRTHERTGDEATPARAPKQSHATAELPRSSPAFRLRRNQRRSPLL